MKSLTITRILALLGGVLLIVGSLMPLWSQNGVSVNGWEGHYLSFGRWIIVLSAAGAACLVLLLDAKPWSWLLACGGIALLEAGLILWQGLKLEAIGFGAWLLLLGAMAILAAGGWACWTAREGRRDYFP